MNVTEAAHELNVSRSHVYTLIEAGLLVPLKRATLRGKRIPVEQIEALKQMPEDRIQAALLAKRRA